MNLHQEINQFIGSIFGNYLVIDKLAQGGMAELFLAKELAERSEERIVVLKCILANLAKGRDFIVMFQDEAEVASRLDHPNIVKIHEVGCIEKRHFIAMEHIAGQNLTSFGRRVYEQDHYCSEPPYQVFAEIILQAARGLQAAHTSVDNDGNPLKLIHRDISPSNLLVSYDGEVKIIDFGIAKATTQEHETGVGVLKGRFSYMSPEQLKNRELDHRCDIFSLGVVLYELTTNRRLFWRKGQAQTIRAILDGDIVFPHKLLPGFPVELEAIILKALEVDPDARFQSAGGMADALESFLRASQREMVRTQLTMMIRSLFQEEKEQEEQSILEVCDEETINAYHQEASTKISPAHSENHLDQEATKNLEAVLDFSDVPTRNISLVGLRSGSKLPSPSRADVKPKKRRRRRKTSTSPTSPDILVYDLETDGGDANEDPTFERAPTRQMHEPLKSISRSKTPHTLEAPTIDLPRRRNKNNTKTLSTGALPSLMQLEGEAKRYSLSDSKLLERKPVAGPSFGLSKPPLQFEDTIQPGANGFTVRPLSMGPAIEDAVTNDTLSVMDETPPEQEGISHSIEKAPEGLSQTQRVGLTQELFEEAKTSQAVPSEPSEPSVLINTEALEQTDFNDTYDSKTSNGQEHPVVIEKIVPVQKPLSRWVIFSILSSFLFGVGVLVLSGLLFVQMGGRQKLQESFVSDTLSQKKVEAALEKRAYATAHNALLAAQFAEPENKEREWWKKAKRRADAGLHLQFALKLFEQGYYAACLRTYRSFLAKKYPADFVKAFPENQTMQSLLKLLKNSRFVPRQKAFGFLRPQHPFSRVRLKKRVMLSPDSEAYKRLFTRIEEEVGKALGASFSVQGITKSWERQLEKLSSQRKAQTLAVYPRAVGHLIYYEALKGSSPQSIAQLLTSYQEHNFFPQYSF